MQRILLCSTIARSKQELSEALKLIQCFYGQVKKILFIPWATVEQGADWSRVYSFFAEIGYELDSIESYANKLQAVKKAEAFYVAGGNTFLLLKRLYESGVMDALKARVRAGAQYMGGSAGANVAGFSIGTTNDMPIVQPPSFRALGLLPFNLNPHFMVLKSKDPIETREERIREFHVLHPQPVLGLRNGAFLEVEGRQLRLKGFAGAVLFQRGKKPVEFHLGKNVSFLLKR